MNKLLIQLAALVLLALWACAVCLCGVVLWLALLLVWPWRALFLLRR